MSEQRDSIDRAMSVSEDLHGTKATPDDIVKNFALYGKEKRVAYLDSLDSEMKNAEYDTDNRSGLIKLYERSKLHKELRARHKRLSEAKR